MPKGIKKIEFSFGEESLTHYGGTLFNSGILQKTQSQKISPELCQISSEEPGLSDGGIDSAYSAYDDSWNRPGREHKIVTKQWCFQITRTNNKNRLKFPAGYPYEDVFRIAVKNIQRMKPL